MTTLQITFVSESAGYQNTLGWYNTRTGEAGILFLSTDENGETTATLDVEQSDLDAGYIGFFLIPNGALRYGTGEESVLNGPLSFDTKGNGDGKILDADGNNLNGAQGEVIFSDPALNKKDIDYTQGDDDGSILGQIAFEDQVKKGDGDFDDLVIDVQVVQENRPPVVEDQVFDVDENTASGTVVGQVVATDPEGAPLSYAIIAGNDGDAFAIDADGNITVQGGLDFETLSTYTLTVQVTDGGGLSDTALVQIGVNNVVETLEGNALDGYVAGATVFADADADGMLDPGEASATTDASGNFTLVDGSGALVMFGGTDVATGLAFTGVLRAPAGATVLTPLTTLIAELVEAGQSPAEASANVAAAFGLAPGVDLLNFDPIPVVAADAAGSAAAAQALAAGVQVQNAIVQIGALLSGAGAADAHAAVVAALAGLVSSGTPVDLTDPAAAAALINAAAAEAGIAPAMVDAVVDDAAAVLAATNAAVAAALAGGSGIAVLEGLAQAAAVAQGPALVAALEQAGAANDPGTLVAEYTGDTLGAKIAGAEIGDVDGGTVGTAGDDVLVGTPANDLIDGLAGNDLLQGLDGNDRLLGGDGDDVLEGGLGHDFLRGGTGNDVLDGGEVADYQSDSGFRDTDRIDYSTASSGVNVNLATGLADDGDGGTDTLEGIESVTGSAFSDVLTGTATFSENWRGGGGNDVIDGGGGFDRAEYVDATAGVSITLGGFAGFSTSTGTVVGDASVGTDALLNVESFVGSDFDDTYVAGLFLSGSLPGGFFSTFNSIEGRGGNDLITGNGATRVEYTNATGGVTVDLALGFATGNASVGTDSFTGVSDVRGSSFADTLTGGNAAFNGFEGYDGRGGDDFIDGGQGWDRADYAFNGAASTGIHVQLAAGIVTGDPLVHGTDTLRGIESVRGTHLGDLFDATGFSGASTNAGWSGTLNEFSGMAGDDIIIGNGNTRIGYTLAREGIVADLTLGTVVGGASVGVDTIVGGVSEVFGTNFDDTLRGSSGNEVLLGLNGDDLLVGGAGNDLMDGGAGIDRVDYSGSGGPVFVDLAFVTANDGLGGTDTLFNVEEVVGTAFNDVLFGDWTNNVLVGGLGNDLLRGGGGNDVLDGGIVADFQSDAGFRDIDRADYSTAFMGVVVNLATGTALDGEGGTDTLSGFEGVIGSMFNDSITGSDAFSQFFRGGAGDDFIDGAGGNDQAEYWDATGAITVNLGFAGDASGTVSGDFSVGFDTLLNVERIVGSDFSDSYFVGAFLSASGPGGTLSAFNSFEGRGGNDHVVGNFATRIEFVGATSGVVVNFELGQATGDASVGTDTFSGVTQVRGSSFADTFIGSNFFIDESFDGRGGNDFMDGRQGFDRADYAFNGPSAVGINVNLAAGTVVGDPVFTGTDTLRSIESIRGTHLDDVYDARGFFGGSTNAGSFNTLNEFEGMAGNDTVWGNGNTRLTFANAREGVEVDLAAGTVTGGASVGNDTLMGGINQMRGSVFDDVLMGSNHGIGFAEVYEGRRGDDTYSGRGGFDQARYDSDPTGAGITVVMAAIDAHTGTVSGDAAIGTDTLIDIVGVVGTWFDDVYDGTGYFSAVSGLSSFNEFEGLGGNDTVTGNGSTRVSYISSWDGVTVDLGAGTASSMATGNDTLINVFNVRGSSQNDTLLGSAGNDTFEGRGGFDFIDGREGFDLVRYDNGSSGAGTFTADAFGTFTATAGGHQTDTLVNIESIRGSNFGDTFDGSASVLGFVFDGRGGDDLLRGGLGADTLTGGLGADTFDFDVLAASVDTITDFEAVPGGDVLDLGELLAASTRYAAGMGGAISDFVRVESAGPDGLLQIDADGAVGPGGWQTLAVLLGGAGLDFGVLLAQGNADIESDVVPGIIEIGTAGDDILLGGPGDDQLFGLLGNDFLYGGAGDDLLDGGIVADLQSGDGFRDTDRVDYSTATTGVNVNLATGVAQDGEGGEDTLIGIESVNGSSFDDILTGSGAFSENFHGGAGNDQIHGGGGFDRAEYHSATSAVTITVGGAGDSSASVSGDVSVGNDTLTGVEQFTGSEFDDTYNAGWFVSDPLPGGFLSSFNSFEGRGGNDTINGNFNTRADYTSATGGVTVNLGAGTATGDASVGNDTLFNVNQVRGSSFADTLIGGANPGFESYHGRGGDDFINGLDGWDRADYSFDGPVALGITVNLAAGTVVGDPIYTGTDTLRSVEAIRGSHQSDVYDATGFSFFSANAGSNGLLNEFEGMAGNDTIIGNGGTRISYVLAREGVEVDLLAGTAVGGASVGTDTLLGGIVEMRGSNFDDVLMGAANGTLFAEIYEGLGGDDTFSGRGGVDRAIYGTAGVSGITVDMATAAGSNIGTVTGDSAVGTDTLIDIAFVLGTFLDDTYDATGYFSTVTGLSSFNEFEGAGGNDTITGNGSTRVSYLSSWSGVTVDLGAGTASSPATGTDTLINVFNVRGSNLDDTLLGSMFNDTFEGRGGFDHIDGGLGFDLVRYDNGAFAGGLFVADAAGAFNAIVPGHDVDYLVNVESIRGSNFDDTFDGSAAFVGYTLDGFGGNDTITGTQGSDTLRGGEGNDLLRGGWGGDFIEGGAGSDRIDYDSLLDSGDTIAGFQAGPGGDVLDLADLLQNETSYAGGAGGPLSDFVRIEAVGFDGFLQIDPDGLFGPQFWQTIAVLLGGAGLDAATLQADGNLDVGAAGGVTRIGTPGNDFLEGGPGDDTLIGDLGNDLLIGYGGNDVLNGGVIADLQTDAGFRDNDRVDYSASPSGVTVNLNAGTASDGYGGSDTLEGIEAVTGSFFDDLLIGADTTFSESFRGGAGNDTIDGGGGNDLAEYLDATGPLLIDLGGPFGGAGGTVSGDASVGFDTLLNVERVMGSDFADTFSAIGFVSASTPGGFLSPFNAFEGRAGDDQIVGNGATRIEYTGAGSAVTVDLELGQAWGDFSVGTDSFSGVSQVRGSRFADTFLGSLFDDSFDGRAGNDQIDGRGGFDRADYAFNGPASVGLTVNLAAGSVVGDPAFSGTDTLTSIEAIRGTHLADTYNAIGFFGSFGTLNEFEGMAGDDTVWGNGNTRLSFASAREDGIVVDLQAGSVTGGASVGNDTLMGGINQMRGSNFADTFKGTNHGTTFAEVYEGRAGDDRFEGRGGYDQARYDTDPTQSGITVDMATAAGSNVGTVTGDLWIGTDTLVDIVAVVGTWFDDAYDGSGYFSATSGLASFNEFEGLGGNDTITGNGSTRVTFISAWAGVTVDLAAGTASGAATGEDTLINIFRVRATNFNDTLLGSAGNDNFDARDGNDVLAGGAGNDILDGGLGFDRVDYSASTGAVTVDLLAGSASDGMGGTDTLSNIEGMIGSAFDDMLSGTNHGIGFAQVYEGRAGNDTYSGRGGFDQARYDADPVTTGIMVQMAAIAGNTGTVTGEAGIIDTDTLIDVVSVVGTWFNDVYVGSGYNSTVSTLGAFNEFEGLGGNDTITGNGSTRVSYISSSAGVTVDLGAGTASGAAVGNDTLINVFNVRGSNFADTLLGSLGADTFEGRGGDDEIDGSTGNDLVRYDNGSFGGGTFIADATGIVMATAPGHDTDTLRNIEQIRGTNFGDLFDGSARFLAFTFDGRGGDDTILGTQDADDLRGGDGNDWLHGGLGGDTLRGEAGADTFDFDLLAESGDTIVDFEAFPGGDVLDIADLLANSTAYNGGAGGPLENFVRVDASGPHSLLQVNPDGGLPSWTTVATLLDNPGLDLNTLLTNGNLDVSVL